MPAFLFWGYFGRVSEAESRSPPFLETLYPSLGQNIPVRER